MKDQGEKGASLIEAAIVMPLFMLFVLAIIDLGRYFLVFILLNHAAQEGVDFAAKLPVNADLTLCERSCDGAPTTWDPGEPPSVCDDYDRYVSEVVERALYESNIVAGASTSNSWVKLIPFQHYTQPGQTCASTFQADVAFLRPGERVVGTHNQGQFELQHITRPYDGEGEQTGWPEQGESWDGILNSHPFQVSIYAEFEPVMPLFPNLVVKATQMAFGGKKTFGGPSPGDVILPTPDPCVSCPPSPGGSPEATLAACTACIAAGCIGCVQLCYDACLAVHGPLGCEDCDSITLCAQECPYCEPTICPPDGAGLENLECQACVDQACLDCPTCRANCIANQPGHLSEFEKCEACNTAFPDCEADCGQECDECVPPNYLCPWCVDEGCVACPQNCMDDCIDQFIGYGMDPEMACTTCLTEYPDCACAGTLCENCEDADTLLECQICSALGGQHGCPGCPAGCRDMCIDQAIGSGMNEYQACAHCNDILAACPEDCGNPCDLCQPGTIEVPGDCAWCKLMGCPCSLECYQWCVDDLTPPVPPPFPWEVCATCNSQMGCGVACPDPCSTSVCDPGQPGYAIMCASGSPLVCPHCDVHGCGCECGSGGGGS